jgi:nicotinate-nucleotide adenylyltransferase
MELFWMIGADSLGDLANWHRIADLVNEVTIVTAARPAFDLPELAPLVKMIGREQTDRILRDCFTTPRIEISSTDVRERVATGRPIDYLTANSVIVYIEQRALYRKSSNPAL